MPSLTQVVSKVKTMNPNDLGKIYLVEECQKISIADFTKRFRHQMKALYLKTEVEASGNKIVLTTSRTGFGGKRYWFSCPLCGGRVGALFKHPLAGILGCRGCFGLEYRKRRYKGMAENDVV